MIGDWSFLKARRFWAAVLFGIIKGLEVGGYLPVQLSTALLTILAFFIGVRTIDRFSEKLAEGIK